MCEFESRKSELQRDGHKYISTTNKKIGNRHGSYLGIDADEPRQSSPVQSSNQTPNRTALQTPPLRKDGVLLIGKCNMT